MTTATAVGLVPPGPSRAASLRTLLDLNRDRLGMMTSAARRFGDAVRLPVGPMTMYFCNHPDYAKHVLADNSANYHKGIGLVHARRALGDGLLTSEGELWRKQRRVIQPAFGAKRIAQQDALIAEEALALVARLRENDDGEPVDILGEMTQLTLGVLGRALLEADLGVFGSVGASFQAVQDQAMFELTTLNLVPTWIPLPGQRRFRRARDDLRGVVDRLVAQRGRGGGPVGDDVLSRLIASVREETDAGVGRQRMRDELITLLLAGHETTASTLGWSFYLIDRHPEVWQRLHAEAVEVLGDRPPTYAD